MITRVVLLILVAFVASSEMQKPKEDGDHAVGTRPSLPTPSWLERLSSAQVDLNFMERSLAVFVDKYRAIDRELARLSLLEGTSLGTLQKELFKAFTYHYGQNKISGRRLPISTLIHVLEDILEHLNETESRNTTQITTTTAKPAISTENPKIHNCINSVRADLEHVVIRYKEDAEMCVNKSDRSSISHRIDEAHAKISSAARLINEAMLAYNNCKCFVHYCKCSLDIWDIDKAETAARDAIKTALDVINVINAHKLKKCVEDKIRKATDVIIVLGDRYRKCKKL